MERAPLIARRHLDDARRAHAQAQGDVDDASEICLRVTAQLRQLMVDDKRARRLGCAAQTKAEPSIAERFRAGATPLRAADDAEAPGFRRRWPRSRGRRPACRSRRGAVPIKPVRATLLLGYLLAAGPVRARRAQLARFLVQKLWIQA